MKIMKYVIRKEAYKNLKYKTLSTETRNEENEMVLRNGGHWGH
jgi:hypothetical protein